MCYMCIYVYVFVPVKSGWWLLSWIAWRRGLCYGVPIMGSVFFATVRPCVSNWADVVQFKHCSWKLCFKLKYGSFKQYGWWVLVLVSGGCVLSFHVGLVCTFFWS